MYPSAPVIPSEARCLGTRLTPQNHLQKGMEHKGDIRIYIHTYIYICSWLPTLNTPPPHPPNGMVPPQPTPLPPTGGSQFPHGIPYQLLRLWPLSMEWGVGVGSLEHKPPWKRTWLTGKSPLLIGDTIDTCSNEVSPSQLGNNSFKSLAIICPPGSSSRDPNWSPKWRSRFHPWKGHE